MSQPASSAGGDEIIPIQTKYMYVTAMSVPRERMIMRDNCMICNGSLGHPCVRCVSTVEDCPVVVGTCNHAFHLHCLEPWLQMRQWCPLCRSPWQQERLIRQN